MFSNNFLDLYIVISISSATNYLKPETVFNNMICLIYGDSIYLGSAVVFRIYNKAFVRIGELK